MIYIWVPKWVDYFMKPKKIMEKELQYCDNNMLCIMIYKIDNFYYFSLVSPILPLS